MANVAEDLSSFGPYLCSPPAFYLQPATDSGNASRHIPVRVHEAGGVAFFPHALVAVVRPGDAAPAYALRVAGSDYMVGV